MRALVISGGGSKGAFAGGVAHHLIEEAGRKYDLYTKVFLINTGIFFSIKGCKVGG